MSRPALRNGVVALVVVASFVVLFYAESANSHASAAGATTDRALTISYDPVTSAYTYARTNINVPLGGTVQFTITSYDPSPAGLLPEASDAQVTGTVGGVMTVSTAGGVSVLSQIAPADVAHTFTLSSGYYHVNIPIPAAPNAGSPVVVRFSVTFATPGVFAWGCVLPCGTDDMSQLGSMYGYLRVS
jgi:heme/copper-type cytochrome/quinol oxidase subunit 2